MAQPIIQVENLGKKYLLCHQPEGRSQYVALRDVIANRTRSLARKINPFTPKPTVKYQNSARDEFWALRNVSFEVKQGDRVGIIGRNGAGKSTLLKLLSRITEPTTGRIKIRGRVASLLEVGTGFHSELSGRENIFLNGAILGMTRVEINRKFDEIVAFAEVERFLDTPVKHFSSGMYMRLAFAVAAYLEPEILVVDEVLAVGDAEFQKKCLGRMKDVAEAGRTIFFVSHQMAAISNLCSSCILLNQGELAFYGETEAAITEYLRLNARQSKSLAPNLNQFRPGWAKPFITAARMLDANGEEQSHFPLGADLTIEITFRTPDSEPLKAAVMGVAINHLTFGVAGAVNTRMTGFSCDRPYTSATMRCTLKHLPLLQGEYTVDLWLGDGPMDVDCLRGYLSFRIAETDIYGTGRLPFAHLGVMFLEPSWEIAPTSLDSACVTPDSLSSTSPAD